MKKDGVLLSNVLSGELNTSFLLVLNATTMVHWSGTATLFTVCSGFAAGLNFSVCLR